MQVVTIFFLILPLVPENIALKGTATQSSIRDFLGDAGNAIDGNRDSDYYHGSCSKTNKDLTPWWRVDLHEKHWVFHVTITNKITYPERLNGAEIHVGNSLENNGNSNTICATVSFIPGGNSTIYHCGRGTQGRYINIVIPGYRGQLSLCEVEVHGVQNVARRGIASQSTTNWGGKAERAIDGNRNGFYHNNSCSHTNTDPMPWWQVDLLHCEQIISVKLYNRIDCCSKRLLGAQVRVGISSSNNGNNNSLCGTVGAAAVGATETINCRGMLGRYVNILLPRKGILTLCEVEVYVLRPAALINPTQCCS
uniref:Fucolectin tachylectin-4 pentraxin-1 domain-containing protein n=1 Tax=Callorhinchus milii TaxID=7868 RepID=A0A4W3H0S7_CALMI